MTIRVEEHIWIPMSDGVRLGARLWLPEDAEQSPVPAILEYIPYRKRDGTRGRDEPMHGYFASQGYAAIRVDMRGTGESDGHMADEYLKQEQDDALEVIDWISRQPWCSGNVGMMGKSWGGFNGLQVAARRPPALKAIITAYSTDNRYTDDIHYMGGLLLNDNLWWGTIMLAYQSRPLDPKIVGDAWRDSWIERLEKLPSFRHFGWSTSVTTNTGNTARSAKTGAPSSARSLPSAHGRTAIPMPFPDFWRTFRSRVAASSVRGAIFTPRMVFPVRRLASCRKQRAGGTIG